MPASSASSIDRSAISCDTLASAAPPRSGRCSCGRCARASVAPSPFSCATLGDPLPLCCLVPRSSFDATADRVWPADLIIRSSGINRWLFSFLGTIRGAPVVAQLSGSGRGDRRLHLGPALSGSDLSALVRRQRVLSQTDCSRRDLDAFVLADELERLLEGELPRW